MSQTEDSQHKVPKCLACLSKGQYGWEDNERGSGSVTEESVPDAELVYEAVLVLVRGEARS